MRLRIVFNGTVPKDDSPDSVNEDRAAIDESRQAFTLSDGASESYDSARWAGLLADAWTSGRLPASRRGIEAAIGEYERACDPSSLSWSKRAAFDRGSYATLLGISVRGAFARVIAVGDSIALGVGVDDEIVSFPYTFAEEFDRRPLLLSTKREANATLCASTVARGCVTRWPLRPGTALMMMTDALGQWLMCQDDFRGRCDTLLDVRTDDDLRYLVRSEQTNGAMKRDDTTLLHLHAEES
ncbi:MAG: hypothetical protein FJY39_09255 [Betaproteobacteria bacterium]|nr:hypothetical protein [Betaproteobacteria bacterium]